MSAQPFAVQELCSGGRGHPGEVGLRGASLARNLQGVQFAKLRLLPARVPISMRWLKMPRISPLRAPFEKRK